MHTSDLSDGLRGVEVGSVSTNAEKVGQAFPDEWSDSVTHIVPVADHGRSLREILAAVAQLG